MDDFDIAPSKIGESAQRVVDRAIEESRRRDHVELMMAVWTPGSYLVREFARHVEGVRAFGAGHVRHQRQRHAVLHQP